MTPMQKFDFDNAMLFGDRAMGAARLARRMLAIHKRKDRKGEHHDEIAEGYRVQWRNALHMSRRARTKANAARRRLLP